MNIIYLSLIIVAVVSVGFKTANACTAFYCINSCGKTAINKGLKLILAVNRDEQVDRITIPADVWLPKNGKKLPETKTGDRSYKLCDQSKMDPPYNLCAWGALDLLYDVPPNYYSTWLGINERGSIGNLLFFIDPTNRTTILRSGSIVGNYIQDSSWKSVEDFMQNLSDTKYNYRPFHYVQFEMSKDSGAYSVYYLNNNDTKPYQRLNPDETNPFIFGISNSDFQREFKKVTAGREEFTQIIKDFGENLNRRTLVEKILKLMQNTTKNIPDENLAAFIRRNLTDQSVEGMSSVQANYFTWWAKAHSRTSTIILVDYNDNVEYYEYNLTNYEITNSIYVKPLSWSMNEFQIKLKPLYKNKGDGNRSINMSANYLTFLFLLCLSYFSSNPISL